LFLLEYFALSHYSQKMLGYEWNWGLATFLAQVLYTVGSLSTIGPTELGALLVFGRPVKELGSGLVFIPFGICSLEKETRLVIQDELPTDPDKIFRPGKEESELNIADPKYKDFKPPIRIPFGYPDKEGLENEDPLDNRVTAEVVPVIRWKITKGKYLTFLTTIGSREDARRQMEDTTVATLMEAFAQITPAVALKGLKAHNENLKKKLIESVVGWGIEIIDAEVKAINFNRSLNEAITSVPEADLEKHAKILIAEGERRKLELEGEGAGAAEKAILDGRTEGLVQMAKKLGVNPELVLSALTAQSITDNPSDKVIIAGSEGFTNLAAMAGAIGETIKKGGSK